MEGNVNRDENSPRTRILNTISYGFGKFFIEFVAFVFSVYAFFFYETKIQLNVWLTSLGFILFALWNAFNDPIIGYLTDRIFKFTPRWGRRFPWIVAGALPTLIMYFLIFTPPDVSPDSGAWIFFAWLVITTCLFDTFASLTMVNYFALFPAKFTTPKSRRTATGVTTGIGILGIAMASLLPPLFLTSGDISSYVRLSGAVVLLAGFVVILSLPGCWDRDITTQREESQLSSTGETLRPEGFLTRMKSALRHKNFAIFVIVYLCYRLTVVSIQGSINYAVEYILGLDPKYASNMMTGFILGILISIPFWIKFSHKIDNNKRVLLIGGMGMAITAALFTLATNLLLFFLVFLGFGIALGGFWTFLSPVLADIIDEAVVETGQRNEAMYAGVQMFFGQLALIGQALSFAIAHQVTGFVEDAISQTSLAVWGIQVHMGVVPAISILLATLLVWKFYDLTPEKVRTIHLQLQKSTRVDQA